MTDHAPIVIVGRFDPSDAVHIALRDAVLHAESACGVVISTRWVAADALDRLDDALGGSAAAIVAPFSTHAKFELVPEVLNAVRWLRTHHVPTLAIEGGFQHMTIEWARNVLGHPDANAVLFDESTEMPIWDQLDRQVRPNLEGVAVKRIKIAPVAGTRTFELYEGRAEVEEEFRPIAAINPDFLPEFEKSGMTPGATTYWWGRHLVGAMESRSLPFYLGTAFLPPLASRHGRPHPLITALIRSALMR